MTRLLIVDDNPQSLYMLQMLLTASGFELELAANGAEALEKARRNPPDLIISDVLMPVMDGFSLCRAWKADERLKPIPFVFYTATYTDPQDEDFALSLGAERFIVKPMEPDKFLAMLHEVIEAHQAGTLGAPREPVAEHGEFLAQYNAALIRKLEGKLLQLEAANRALERELAARQERERALADQQALLTAIYRNAPLVMMVVDRERRVQQINGFAAQLAGWPAGEMLGLRSGEALRCLHALDAPQGCGFGEYCRQCVIRDTVLHTLETGEAHLQVEAPYYFQSAAGEVREMTFLCSATPLSVGEESLVLVTLLDITERKQAEAQVRESEEKYRSLFNQSTEGIYLHDLEGHILDVNEMACLQSGYSREEWLRLTVFDGHPSESATNLPKDEILRIWKEEWKPGQKYTFEVEHRRKDSTIYPVEISTGIVRYKGENAILAIVKDITARKQAEARIAHLNRVLRAIRDVNQLITHERDRDTLLRRACEVLISTRGYRSAWVALRGEDGTAQTVAESGIGEGFAPVRQALERGGWPDCYRLAQERPDGIAVIHNPNRNCTTCDLAHCHRDTAALAGVLRHGGRDYGVLVVALPVGLADDPEEQSLFRELAGDLGYAMHAMELARERAEAERRIREQLDELRRWHSVTLGREGRIIELKREVNELLRRLGEEIRYRSGEAGEEVSP